MPHMQIRVNPKRSPRDINGVLDLVADINLLGIAGSSYENDGEIGLMLHEGRDYDAALAALGEYEPRQVGDPQGMHLDYARNEPGQLLKAVRRARVDHPFGTIMDIGIGSETIQFFIGSDDMVVRDTRWLPGRRPGWNADRRLPDPDLLHPAG